MNNELPTTGVQPCGRRLTLDQALDVAEATAAFLTAIITVTAAVRNLRSALKGR